jgi:DNA-binding LacI/PurR family transcriptional regulator
MVRARQIDIARQAGVSEATVSRVLNGHPGISEATRQTVLTALDVLGFERPNLLRRKSAGLVGLILPELTNPIFPAFAQAVETALARRGFTPILCTQTPGGIHEDDYVQLLLDHGVAGIINISGLHADTDAKPERYIRLREIGLPLVLVNGEVPGLGVPTICDDASAAVELAVSHQAQLGHERNGLAAGPARFVPVIRKVEGFRSAMARHVGLPTAGIDDLVVHQLFTVEGGATAAETLLAKGATAIVAASDLMALGVVRAVRAAVGPDFPLILRWSQWKQQDYAAKLAATPELLEEFLAPLTDAGVDIYHCSQRRFWEAEFEGSDMNLAGWVKKISGKPTITVGSVGLSTDFITSFAAADQVGATGKDLAGLAARFERGEFDLVAVGRAVIANPDWVNRVRAGDIDGLKGYDPASLATLY